MSVRVEPRLEPPSEVSSIASGPASHIESGHDPIEIQQYGNVQHSFDMLQDSDSSRAVSRATMRSESSGLSGSGLSSYADAPSEPPSDVPSDADEATAAFYMHDAHSIDQLRQHLMSPASSSSHGLVSVTPIKPALSPLTLQNRHSSSYFGTHAHSPLSLREGEAAASSSFMLSPQTPRRRGTRPGPSLPPPLPLARPPEIPSSSSSNSGSGDPVPPSPLQRLAAHRFVAPSPPGRPPPAADASLLQARSQIQTQGQNPSKAPSQSQGQNPNQNPSQTELQQHHHQHQHQPQQQQQQQQLQFSFGQPRQVSDTRSLTSHGSHVSDEGHIEPPRHVREHAFSYIKRSGPTMSAQGQYLAGLPRLPVLPVAEPRHGRDLELEKRDIWGRRHASPVVAWVVLFACTAFPPLWLLLGAGYFDSVFGVMPRAVKLTATALALGILAAVIALVTVFGILRT